MPPSNSTCYETESEFQQKISSYEEVVGQLDIFYGIIKRQLLRYQSPVTGLFPCISTDETIGSVRESIYCAAAIWSLYQSYRRIDDDRGKSYELGQSAVKCMRGILTCWIKQSARIEQFKQKQCGTFALHSKFHLLSGAEVYSDEEYNHLQIDVVSLYLIFLVQMITSGLQIIYTQSEVAFVQNLVYYVERAYRTPDFGMWERGSKYNDGVPEIHASSIGMAKSALEAINGCNLFGDKGASWSVIYVDIDAHNRNRSIFETLLPRESSSKAVDISLLPTVSFPAFASHEVPLVNCTKQQIIDKLKGVNGFKRFSRDGFKCVLEDTSRRFYKNGESKEFENVECEWPITYMFLIIDGMFFNIPEQVQEYQELLSKVLTKDEFGDPLVPMYFYIAEEDIDKERKEPGSAKRVMSEEGSKSICLWNQAMYIISQLLCERLLNINELDPVRRYLPSFSRPRRTGRYSAFQAKPLQTGTATDLVVQIVLIAESMRLQAMMATYGIQTQTPHEVEPVQIWSSNQLVKVYGHLGVDDKLKLSGRPQRPIGSLGTSKVYRVCGMSVLCYPLIFEVSEFYLYRDMALLIDDIKTELQFVSRYWRLSGRPTVCLLIREEHMRDPQFKEMLNLMAMLKKGYCEGIKVRIGRLQNLISSSCIEHLDFMSSFDTPDFEVEQFQQIEHEYIGYQSLTDVPLLSDYSEEHSFIKDEFETRSIPDILEAIRNTTALYSLAQLYGVLLAKTGPDYEFKDKTVLEHIESLYHTAGSLHYWLAVRYCSSLLHHTVDSISPFITALLVNGKQISVGVAGHEETVLDKPLVPMEIRNVIYSTIQPHDMIQAVLQQEVVLYCGRLITTSPHLFKGILKIRVGWVLEAIKHYLKITNSTTSIGNLSPFRVRKLLYKVLSVSEWATKESLSYGDRRRLEGCVCRSPTNFHLKVWDVLSATEGLKVGRTVIMRQPILTDMSRSELAFSLLVEEALNQISEPEYRQIIVELLRIVSTILTRNPEITFLKQFDLDDLVDQAIQMFSKDADIADETAGRKEFLTSDESLAGGYLARAVVNTVLKRSRFMDDCRLS
nr:probable phosphorylase b kinase regulatory subunit beta [Halyomorpha halys]